MAFGSRRVVLGGLVVALLPAFAFTYLIVSRYKDERQQLAVEWRSRGTVDLSSRPAVAVADYETALSYADDPDDRFELSQALVNAGRYTEAKAQLLTLWTEEPGNGRVNLQLGRLAVHAGDEADAVRYYHAAIDGAWDSGAPAARRTARIELARFLLHNGQNIRAQAELIAMIDDLPPDAALITDVGSLLVDAGADARAMSLFQRALTVRPGYARAERLAGGVAFRSGNYSLAHTYLVDASKAEGLDPVSEDTLAVATQVLTLDPTQPHLTMRERAVRTLACIAVAQRRLAGCSAAADRSKSPDEDLGEIKDHLENLDKLRDRELVRDPDLIDTAMATVFQVAALPASACGPPSTDVRALQLLAGQRRASPR